MSEGNESGRLERIQEIRDERERIENPFEDPVQGVGDDLFGDVEPTERPTTVDPFVQRQKAQSDNDQSDECAVCWVCKKYYSSYYTYCPHCGRDLTVVEDGEQE